MKHSHHISASKDKHESDIPRFDTRAVFEEYDAQRHLLLKRIHSIPIVSGSINPSQLSEPICKVWDQFLNEGRLPKNVDSDTFYRIEKRFVVHGNLNYRKSIEVPLEQQFCLALMVCDFLHQAYAERGDLNALNSAIRLLDKMDTFFPEGVRETQVRILENLISQEKNYVNAL